MAISLSSNSHNPRNPDGPLIKIIGNFLLNWLFFLYRSALTYIIHIRLFRRNQIMFFILNLTRSARALDPVVFFGKAEHARPPFSFYSFFSFLSLVFGFFFFYFLFSKTTTKFHPNGEYQTQN